MIKTRIILLCLMTLCNNLKAQAVLRKRSRAQVRDAIVSHYIPVQEKVLELQRAILEMSQRCLTQAKEIIDQTADSFLASAPLASLEQREQDLKRCNDKLDHMISLASHDFLHDRHCVSDTSKQTKDVVK